MSTKLPAETLYVAYSWALRCDGPAAPTADDAVADLLAQLSHEEAEAVYLGDADVCVQEYRVNPEGHSCADIDLMREILRSEEMLRSQWYVRQWDRELAARKAERMREDAC